MRHPASADTDLEIIPPEWDEAERIAQLIAPPAPPATPRRKAPVPWIIAAVAVVVLLVTGAIEFHQHDAPSHDGQAPPTIPSAVNPTMRPTGSPSVDPGSALTAHIETLRGHGLIAVASNGHLRILDGQKGVMHDEYRPSGVSHPTWSASGRWLAYGEGDTQVWLERADGTQAHPITTAPVVRPDTVAWSPVADTLAVVTRVGLELISPGKAPRSVPHGLVAWSAVWSPDGRRIAATSPQGRGLSVLVLNPANGTTFTVGAPDEYLTVAGWWPNGGGVLAWRQPQPSASAAADGEELVSISLSGREVRLTTMLPHSQWLSWSPDHRHVAVVEGGGREAYTGKHLAVCDVVAGTCRTIPGTPGTVALDPAWSPDGSQIAYVQADEDSRADVGEWRATRQLWTMKPDGSRATRLGALDGVDAPRWSADSKQLLVVGGENALWLVDRTFVAPVASRLYEGEFPPGYYYGFVDWSQTLAWHGR